MWAAPWLGVCVCGSSHVMRLFIMSLKKTSHSHGTVRRLLLQLDNAEKWEELEASSGTINDPSMTHAPSVPESLFNGVGTPDMRSIPKNCITYPA